MKKPVLLFIFSSLLLFTFNCEYRLQEQKNTGSVINTAHLDSLYEEIIVDNKTISQTPFRQTSSPRRAPRRVGIIHIYSEYPDYKWVGDADEGIACVDDAARAAVFYLKYSGSYADESSELKARKLLDFILYMQSENGFFYNFIFDDYSINREHKNSKNESNWWSWRAMWALSEGYKYFVNIDKEFSEDIYTSLEKVTEELKKIGIVTFADIDKITLDKAKQLLLRRFDEVMHYDYTIRKKSLSTQQKRLLNNYSTPRYWINDLKA